MIWVTSLWRRVQVVRYGHKRPRHGHGSHEVTWQALAPGAVPLTSSLHISLEVSLGVTAVVALPSEAAVADECSLHQVRGASSALQSPLLNTLRAWHSSHNNRKMPQCRHVLQRSCWKTCNGTEAHFMRYKEAGERGFRCIRPALRNSCRESASRVDQHHHHPRRTRQQHTLTCFVCYELLKLPKLLTELLVLSSTQLPAVAGRCSNREPKSPVDAVRDAEKAAVARAPLLAAPTDCAPELE